MTMQSQHVEKRKITRFDIDAPAWIDLPGKNGLGRTCGARILNISSAGAFLELNNDKIDENELIEISVLLSVKKLSELFGIDDHVLWKVGGRVLRKNGGNAAVEFVRKIDVYSAHQGFLDGGKNVTQ